MGAPLLYAHGFGCNQEMWRFIAPAFEQTRKTVLFDYVGHGKSDLAAYDRHRYSSLRGYAQDILDVCEANRLSDVTIVGHSVSSMIGLLAAIERPQLFRAIVMVAPSPAYINDGDYHGGFERKDIDGLLETLDANYLGWAAAMAPVIMGTPQRPELADELTNSFCRTDPEIAKQFAHVTFLSDLRAELAKSPVPSLLLQCTHDAIAPVSVGKYMHAHMPRSTLTMIETTGHCPHLSAPEATIAAMRAFLANA
jgi:sigma-B regulation protein RsbQ